MRGDFGQGLLCGGAIKLLGYGLNGVGQGLHLDQPEWHDKCQIAQRSPQSRKAIVPYRECVGSQRCER